MPLPQAERITYAEYKQLPEDGKRYEVIDGELHVTPSPSWVHQRISYWITRLVGSWIDDRGLGVLQAAPLDVIMASELIVQPDHIFIRKARIRQLVDRSVHGAPDLVVEILSPSTAGRDQIIKRAVYAREGIQEYWIVDPEARAVKVLTLEEGHYFEAGSVTGDRALPSRVLEGLPVHACDLFQE